VGKQATVFAAAALVVVAMAMALLSLTDGEPQRAGVTVHDATRLERDAVSATLVVGTRDGGRRAPPEVVWMTLVCHDRSTGRGGIVYIPAHTAGEVPGRGLQGLGGAFASGGMPLLRVSTENLLGVSIDHYLELSERDARAFLQQVDPLPVDVPTDVRIGAGGDRARIVFSAGPQRLSARGLRDLLYVVGLEGDDAELGSRHLAFWDALFERFSGDPEALASAVERGGSALEDSDARSGSHARLLGRIADLPDTDRTLGVLPVKQVSAGGEELYEVDGREAEELLSLVARWVEPTEQKSVQVLNGNGVPGIGAEAGRKLVGHGFRVILSGNAPRLGYRRTLIVAYDASPESLAAARRARELLGVGRVQVSAQPQGIVDLTVVVGKDFLGRE